MTAPAGAAGPRLLRELYPFRAQLAYALEQGDAAADVTSAVRYAQTLAAYTALQAQIAALEQERPARWSRPDTPAVDWCCPQRADGVRPGPPRCGVCEADEEAPHAAP